LLLLFLLLAGTVQAQAEKRYAASPTGEGDPDQVTCRPAQPLPASRLLGPEVCKKNAEWARYRRDGMDVAPDGIHDVPLNTMSQRNCRSSTAAGGTINGPTNLGITCD
jgi:hypothetical protein